MRQFCKSAMGKEVNLAYHHFLLYLKNKKITADPEWVHYNHL